MKLFTFLNGTSESYVDCITQLLIIHEYLSLSCCPSVTLKCADTADDACFSERGVRQGRLVSSLKDLISD